MRKVVNVFRKNYKLLLAFILGGFILGGLGTAYAVSVASSSVSYDNTTSGAIATDVKGALDELYTKASKWVNPNDMGTPQYYAFGAYKGWCSSSDINCNSFEDFPTTSTTPPSGKNVYAAKYADGQYGVCIKRNEKEHCFRGRNYIAESKHVQQVLSGCGVYYNRVNCYDSDFWVYVSFEGRVYCSDRVTGEQCDMDGNGSVHCN